MAQSLGAGLDYRDIALMAAAQYAENANEHGVHSVLMTGLYEICSNHTNVLVPGRELR